MNMKHGSTLENFEKFLKVKNYSNRTVQTYSYFLKLFLKQYDTVSPLHLTQKHLNDFVYNFKFTSTAQQNQFYSALILFYKNILKSNITKVNLSRPLSEKKLPQVIDKDFLLNQISKITNLKHKTIISLAYSTGMRVSEVINLKIEDIDSKRMVINIKNGKGRKDRIVPLSETILKLLREYWLQYRSSTKTGLMFIGEHGKQYSPASCNAIVKKYLGKQYHFHLLRHSCFTSLLEGGTDLRVIQKIAGHSSSKTTEIYTHVSTNLLSKVNTPI